MAAPAHADAVAGLPALDRNDGVLMGFARIQQRINDGGALDPPPNTQSLDDPILYTIASYGAHHLVDIACATGADVNAFSWGHTPLMKAVINLYPRTVASLLAAGADVTLSARDDTLSPGQHYFRRNRCGKVDILGRGSVDVRGSTVHDMTSMLVEGYNATRTPIPPALMAICTLLRVSTTAPTTAFECPVCCENINISTAEDVYCGPCAHTLCLLCASALLTPECPLCRTAYHSPPRARVFVREMFSSTPFDVDLRNTTARHFAATINASGKLASCYMGTLSGFLDNVSLHDTGHDTGHRNLLLQHRRDASLYDLAVRHGDALYWRVRF